MSAAGQGWLDRLRGGLGRSSAKLTGGIADLLTKRKLDRAALDELEEVLIAGDLGVATAGKLKESLAKKRLDKEITPQEVKTLLADEIAFMLDPVARPLAIDFRHRPFVVLVCGVNGSGKTTTIAKLANQWRQEGHSVMLAA
ncbi:MAG TPA: signal recognition particle-docking protein FtsY, partial [Rhodospirillales bacterium]|nr:signal recognition particle-docking protein FtsY [Rhodospirillales bacterium]